MHVKPIMLLIAVALLQGCGEEPQVSQEKKQQPQKAAVAPPQALPSISQTAPDNPFARPKQGAASVLNAKSVPKKAVVEDEEEAGSEFLPQAGRQSAVSLGGRRLDEAADQRESTLDSEISKFLPTGEVANLKTELEGGTAGRSTVNINITDTLPESSGEDIKTPSETEDTKTPSETEDTKTPSETEDTDSEDNTTAAGEQLAEKPVLTCDEAIERFLDGAKPPLTAEERIQEKARMSRTLHQLLPECQ